MVITRTVTCLAMLVRSLPSNHKILGLTLALSSNQKVMGLTLAPAV